MLHAFRRSLGIDPLLARTDGLDGALSLDSQQQRGMNVGDPRSDTSKLKHAYASMNHDPRSYESITPPSLRMRTESGMHGCWLNGAA